MGKDFQHENPLNWKWGIIYFNKADSRVLVPKRHKMLGWTFNFAHPISYVILALIFATVYLLRTLNK
ncbi:hypothetical protein OC25_04830 [Pedobacter kyungheensis]|uniref:DUF5808 domain-containing protein n=1 Tax=Pedobacter kyungheensis TaxID=1069985 RepID=A0A0C1DP91_9SPHI|nr:DUF5808 domain-containing protein [Pedobacter kyungheensis]KIA95880.1 hypothetical protein OC25_04830 [Pedobacter kyungheensis]